MSPSRSVVLNQLTRKPVSLEQQRDQFAYTLNRLDSYADRHGIHTWFDAPPTPEDKRFLADLLGLHLVVFPVGVLPDAERIEVTRSERKSVLVPQRIEVHYEVKGGQLMELSS
jgi:hypothetical protein